MENKEQDEYNEWVFLKGIKYANLIGPNVRAVINCMIR